MIAPSLDDRGTVEPLHFDCVVCQAQVANCERGEETMVLLVMLLSGTSLEEIRRNLCFGHRREAHSAVRADGGAA